MLLESADDQENGPDAEGQTHDDRDTGEERRAQARGRILDNLIRLGIVKVTARRRVYNCKLTRAYAGRILIVTRPAAAAVSIAVKINYITRGRNEPRGKTSAKSPVKTGCVSRGKSDAGRLDLCGILRIPNQYRSRKRARAVGPVTIFRFAPTNKRAEVCQKVIRGYVERNRRRYLRPCRRTIVAYSSKRRHRKPESGDNC